MANIQYYDVILKPVITEKSMDLMACLLYTSVVVAMNLIKEGHWECHW